MQCFKAKCRCVPRPEGGSCERSVLCFLFSELSSLPTPSLGVLEVKIDRLLSAMQSIVSSTGSATDVQRLLSEATSPPSKSGSTNTPVTYVVEQHGSNSQPNVRVITFISDSIIT